MRRIVMAVLFMSAASLVWTYATTKPTTAVPSISTTDDKPIVDWVSKHAVRLQTPEAGHGFADMQPLKKMIGNARIVSLGEATHGSREFFQLKHRMMEFLATEMGFTIFSIEANMPEAYRLNDYVLNGMDGVPYAANDRLDLDFESPLLDNAGEVRYTATTPLGFHAGGDGYQVQFDNGVFHTGKQSLRMKYLGTSASAAEPVDPKLAASTWQGVIRHIEESRAAYAKKGAAERDIEWAIQNTRVVLQCMQLRANEVSRDHSMADNIKWILDQNPGAKIVLWAHNGHVATGGYRGYEPMGVSLRKMFGAQMVVFGFAFNQGSFQARGQEKPLRDFTVPPAPAGSLDATFAATGIPLFAIDLRDAPKSGPVAMWLSEPHKSRSIGAVYSEDSAAQYLMDLIAPQSYDAMLFVEKTTAARRNP